MVFLAKTKLNTSEVSISNKGLIYSDISHNELVFSE